MKAKIIILNMVLIPLFFTILNACNQCSTDKKIIENYYLWGDASLSESICYLKPDGDFDDVLSPDFSHADVIDFIKAVGFSDEVIIVKSKNLDTLINGSFAYYIIPLKNKVSKFPSKNFYGPMTEKEYWRKRWELKVPISLNFSIFPIK